MVELPKGFKTEQNLIEILEKYPTVSVIEENTGDSFRIKSFDSDTQTEQAITVYQQYRKETGTFNTVITYVIPDSKKYAFIEFTPTGLDLTGELYELKEELEILAKSGLEIMQVYKELEPQARYAIRDTYANRIYDARVAENIDFMYTGEEVIENALQAINRDLNPE